MNKDLKVRLLHFAVTDNLYNALFHYARDRNFSLSFCLRSILLNFLIKAGYYHED